MRPQRRVAPLLGLALLRARRPTSAMVVSLAVHEHVIGTLTFLRTRTQRVGAMS